MPELPEVEIMTRALGRWTLGRTLRRVEVVDPRVFGEWSSTEPLLPLPTPVRAARRRAKYCLLDLQDHTLVLHFRMTGGLLAGVTRGSGRARLRLWLDGAGPAVVDLVDPRCLAQAWVLPRHAVTGWLKARRLGPEPWPQRRTGAWWEHALAGLRGPIKPALLRQDRVAGLGNICASETLWRAGIAPTLAVPALSSAQWDALAAAVPEFIDHVLATEGASHSRDEGLHYISQGGPNPFAVYGKAGQPCPRCGTSIQRLVQSGRGTWCCLCCQPET